MRTFVHYLSLDGSPSPLVLTLRALSGELLHQPSHTAVYVVLFSLIYSENVHVSIESAVRKLKFTMG